MNVWCLGWPPANPHAVPADHLQADNDGLALCPACRARRQEGSSDA